MVYLSSYFADYAEGVENLQIGLHCELLLLLNCCLFYLHITENKYRILLVSHEFSYDADIIDCSMSSRAKGDI